LIRKNKKELPNGHGRSQKSGGADASKEQVGWQLHEQIPNKQNARSQIVISAFHSKIFLKGAQAGLGQVTAAGYQ
jgi:hypothetical protein